MAWNLDSLDELVNTNAAESLDSSAVSSVLSTPPFLIVDGLFNLRDISDGTQTSLKQGYCFRCGSLERITEHGKDELKQLGVKTIFDLRSARETSQFPDPEIDGIETVAAQTNTDPLATVQYSDVCSCQLLSKTHAIAKEGIACRDVYGDARNTQKCLEHDSSPCPRSS